MRDINNYAKPQNAVRNYAAQTYETQTTSRSLRVHTQSFFPVFVAGVLCALCLMLLSVCAPAKAEAYPAIVTSKDCSVTISFQYDGVPVEGATFKIWRVASVDASAQFTLLETYRGSGVKGSNGNKFTVSSSEEYAEMAGQLQAYIQKKEISPTATGTTDSDGKVTISMDTAGNSLQPGLYLMDADPVDMVVDGVTHTYTVKASMFMLPTLIDGAWDYSPTIEAKPGDPVEPDPDPTPTPTPSTQSLSVVKVWDDSSDAAGKRPDSVEVTLLKNGEVYDSVELTAAGSWRHQWSGLDASATWTLLEEDVPTGYTVGVTRESSVFTVTNTLASEPDPTDPTDPDEPEPTDPTEPDEPTNPTEPTDPGTDNPSDNPTDTPGTTTGTNGKTQTLSKTGQAWLPASVCAGAGVVLLLLALVVRRRERNKNAAA